MANSHNHTNHMGKQQQKIMCLYPQIRTNKKYTITKKNKGIIPICNDERLKAVPTKCRKCIECVKAKAREWQIRLKEDIKTNKNAIFITLTFSNEEIKKLLTEIGTYRGYETDNEIARIAIRRFTNNWKDKYGKAPRHWLITELGHEGTENIHLHGLLWINKETTEQIKNEKITIRKAIAKTWKYGYIWPKYDNQLNYVNNKTINYITKYITKQDKDHKYYTPKMFTSAGIGENYINTPNAKTNTYNPKIGQTKETYTNEKGYKIGLPIYLRNKLYTEEEREKLWIEKLNKNERYVMGEKIKGTEEEYYKALEYHRAKAKRLGYNDDSKNWTKLQYENQRRKFNMEKRLK